MKNLTLKKAAAVVLVALLTLVAGDLTLREHSDVKATVQKVKAKVEALLGDDATEDDATEVTPLIAAPETE